LTLYLTVFGSALLTLWVGAEYAEYGYIASLLAANFMLDTATYPGTIVLMAIDRHRSVAWMALADGLLNLALSIALIGPLGLLGVALGTLVSTLAVQTVFIVPYTAKALSTTYSDLLRSIVMPLVAPTAGYLAVLLALRAWLGPTSAAGAIAGLAAGVTFVVLYVRFGATTRERELYFQYARSMRNFVARPPR